MSGAREWCRCRWWWSCRRRWGRASRRILRLPPAGRAMRGRRLRCHPEHRRPRATRRVRRRAPRDRSSAAWWCTPFEVARCEWRRRARTNVNRRCESRSGGDHRARRCTNGWLARGADANMGLPISRPAMRFARSLLLLLLAPLALGAQHQTLLAPARVFDGVVAHDGWVVLVQGDSILAAGPAASVRTTADAQRIDLPGATLLPGLIDAHSHVFLHPYSETPWDDQVLHEPLALRVARATNHVRNTLLAGFTTIRDLGTEGAGESDVGLKQAIEQGIIPGPRMLVVTRAIVATGSYGTKG